MQGECTYLVLVVPIEHVGLMGDPDGVLGVVHVLNPLAVFAYGVHAAFVQLEQVHLSVVLLDALSIGTISVTIIVVYLGIATEAAAKSTHTFSVCFLFFCLTLIVCLIASKRL